LFQQKYPASLLILRPAGGCHWHAKAAGAAAFLPAGCRYVYLPDKRTAGAPIRSRGPLPVAAAGPLVPCMRNRPTSGPGEKEKEQIDDDEPLALVSRLARPYVLLVLSLD